MYLNSFILHFSDTHVRSSSRHYSRSSRCIFWLIISPPFLHLSPPLFLHPSVSVRLSSSRTPDRLKVWLHVITGINIAVIIIPAVQPPHRGSFHSITHLLRMIHCSSPAQLSATWHHTNRVKSCLRVEILHMHRSL